jgi:hypothetical protein
MMRSEGTAPAIRPPAITPAGVLFLYSPNLSLRVRYGSLVVDLGRGRTHTVSRASDPRLRRLVLCGFGGWMTFEVPAWIVGVGASWLHLDLTGGVLGQGPGGISPNLPALRRAQALAAGSDVGMAIGRDLLRRKLGDQAASLRRLPGMDGCAEEVERTVSELDRCSNAEQLRIVEAGAAAAWWGALADLPVAFVPPDEAKVPDHWLRIGRRRSSLTGAPRRASGAAHAMWNYAYALAAAEVEIALRSSGLDPGVSPTGLHVDTPSRSSATYDLLEAMRGTIDDLILATLAERRFRRRDFVQQPDGRVRLTAPLARELADAVMPLVRDAVAPLAEALARTLGEAVDGPANRLGRGIPTHLTGEARSRGRDGVRKGARRKPGTARARLRSACLSCGVVLDDRGRTYCDECLPERRQQVEVAFTAAALAALARMRDADVDPAQTPEARAKLSESMSKRGLDVAAWDREHGERPDPEVFRRDILPGLQGVPLARIVVRTGLSLRYASLIRRGEKVPHPLHWDALRSIALMDDRD